MEIRALEDAAVDEEILIAKALLRCIRTADEAGDGCYRCVRRYVHHVVCHMASEHILYPELQGLGRSEHIDVLAVVGKGEACVGTGKGDSCEFRDYVLELHIVGLEELSSCRHIVEQVADAEVSSSRGRGLLCRKVLRICKINLAADLILLAPGLEGDLSHRRYRRQSLTSESEGQDVLEVFRRMELGSGMTLEAEHRLVRRHSAAVVDDLDQGTAGILDDHGHLVCTRIHGILHQLLHHGRRSLHDLSRGDHVRYVAW